MTVASLWWNSVSPYNVSIADACDPIVSQEKFLQLCPYYYFLAFDIQDKEEYWKNIHHKLCLKVRTDVVPDPLQDFSNFLDYIHMKKSLFCPTTFNELKDHLEFFDHSDIETYLVYECPLIFKTPSNYLRMLTYVQGQQHEIWLKIKNDSYLVDILIEKFNGMFVIHNKNCSKDVWDTYVMLCSFYYNLYFRTCKYNVSSYQCAKYVEFMFNLIPNAPNQQALSILTIIFDIIRLGTRRVRLESISSALQDLLTNSISFNNDVYRYLIMYAINNSNIIPLQRVVSTMIKKGITSTFEINILLNISELINPLQIITFLLKTAHFSKLFHRSCMYASRKIIRKYIPGISKKELEDFVKMYIKKSFQSISLCFSKQKYKTRVLLMIESLSSLYQLKQEWVKNLLNNYSASIYAKENVPYYFRMFFPQAGAVDDSFLKEITMLQNIENFPYKTFPFDINRNSLHSISSSGLIFTGQPLLQQQSKRTNASNTPSLKITGTSAAIGKNLPVPSLMHLPRYDALAKKSPSLITRPLASCRSAATLSRK